LRGGRARAYSRAVAKKQSNTALYVALAVAALALVGAVVGVKFLSSPPPPPPPPPPPTAERSVTSVLRYTEGYYRAILDEDARKYHVAPPPLDELGAPFKHALELSSARPLRIGETIETPHLKLTAEVLKEWSTGGDGQGFRYQHLVLAIANRGDGALAYRVDTTVSHPERCRTKGAIPHDAIALAAGERARRTECLWHPGETLTVDRVEVIELPPLSYHYVSRLDPTQIGLDRRTADGHAPPRGKPCPFVPWREIESSGAAWADVIDFYARHSCDEYAFFAGYHFRDAPGPLPVRPPEPTSAPADAAARD